MLTKELRPFGKRITKKGTTWLEIQVHVLQTDLQVREELHVDQQVVEQHLLVAVQLLHVVQHLREQNQLEQEAELQHNMQKQVA